MNKKYEIEYKLSNNDVCRYIFNGRTKTEAIRKYTRETCRTKASIISINFISNEGSK